MTPHHYYFINRIVSTFKEFEFKAVFEQTEIKEDAQYFHELSMWGEWIYGGLPIWSDEADNINRCLGFVKEWKPDLGIVFGTRKIFKVVIDAFPDGLLNVHRGIIQKSRGLDSTYWAIYNNDFMNIGVTIHKVDEGLDTGSVVAQGRMMLTMDMFLPHLRLRETELATSLVIYALDDYLVWGKFSEVPQAAPGKYYSRFPEENWPRLIENFTEYRIQQWQRSYYTTA
jgi:methionyl-tRNA formyltransferase